MSRNLLQLLDFVTAPLQQIDHAPRSGEVSSACHGAAALQAPYFRFDERKPLQIVAMEQSSGGS